LILIVFRESTNGKHVGSGMMAKYTGYQDTDREKNEQKYQTSTETTLFSIQ